MNGKKADMVFTDAPYGISIVNKNGFVGGVSLWGELKESYINVKNICL